MKRKLNEEAIADELRTGSLFFRRPEAETAEEPQSHAAPADPPAAVATMARPTTRASRTAVRSAPAVPEPPSEERPYGRTAVRIEQRVLKRHPFEFYRDQLDALKQLSLSEQLTGGRGNMSEMVREALDAYLATRRAGEGT